MKAGATVAKFPQGGLREQSIRLDKSSWLYYHFGCTDIYQCCRF